MIGPRAGRPLVTGIGSLPFASVEEAIRFVEETSPLLPYFPQLPNRSTGELMLAQLVDGNDAVASLSRDDAIATLISEPSMPQHSFSAWLAFLAALDAGAFPHATAIKSQVVGPITGGRWLAAGRGIEEEIADRVVRLALIQIAELKRRSARVILQLDEPGLSDATHTERARLARAVSTLRDAGAITMIHCCARLEEDSAFFAAGADILSFDAMLNPPETPLVATFARHLKAGGTIAWGLAPTGPRQDGEGDACLAAATAWHDAMARAGHTMTGLATPACGLANCGSGERAAQIMELCRVEG